MLRPIGWWIESLADEERPAPQELVGQQPAEIKTPLVRYLASGLRLIQYRGFSWCRFLCGIDHSKMGSWDVTDGVWVWPERLAHYVEAHSVLLPETFVDHALSGTVPRTPDSDQDYDFSDWFRWCADRRSTELMESRRRALIAAQGSEALEEMTRAASLEREHGLSTEKCQWNGCVRQALSGRSICAEHWWRGAGPGVVGLARETAFREWLRQVREPR